MARKHPGVDPIGNGRYRIRGRVRHPKTGRWHEIDRRVKATDAAAAARRLESARAAWLAKRSSAAAAEDGRRRLGPALDSWYAQKEREVKRSTASTYKSAVTFWKDVLGDYYLDAIEPSDVREVLAGAAEAGSGDETLSGKLRVLRTFAAEERCSHLVEGIRLKRGVRDEERMEDEGRGLEVAELRRLLKKGPLAWTMKSGEVRPAWRRAWALLATLIWTGMRFGEAAALEWGDVDLELATIRVRRAVWHGYVDHPKARASKRVIAIPAELVDTLREHRAAMLRKQQKGVSTPLVFPSRRPGRTPYVTGIHARKSMLRALKEANVDVDRRPVVHMLRHTWNNLVRQNAPELVRQALVGHADEANNERYSKVGMDEKVEAVAKVVRLVKGGPS